MLNGSPEDINIQSTLIDWIFNFIYRLIISSMGEKRLSFDSTNDFILWGKNKVYLKLIEPSKIILI